MRAKLILVRNKKGKNYYTVGRSATLFQRDTDRLHKQLGSFLDIYVATPHFFSRLLMVSASISKEDNPSTERRGS